MSVLARLAPPVWFALTEFGPLLVFWALALTFGTKAAIGGSVVFIIADAAWRYRRRIPATRLYIFSSVLTVMFGAIDLFAVTPFMLKYKSVVTNIATGVAFIVGGRGAKPSIACRNRGCASRYDPHFLGIHQPRRGRMGWLPTETPPSRRELDAPALS